MSKWTKDEELELIKDISFGLNLNRIGEKHNRTASAIEMRLKKIIYENVSAGRSFDHISKLLKMNTDRIRQYFKSYKDFKEKHTEKMDVFDNYSNLTTHGNNPTDQFGGAKNNSKTLDTKIKQLELENKLVSLVVENKNLTLELNKLIKDGKVDKNIKNIIKEIRKTKI